MKRRRIIKVLPTTEEHKVIEVDLYYHIGGMNYFTNTVKQRGLYISASPIVRKGMWKTYTCFSGVNMLVKPMARFSQKVLDAYSPTDEQIDRLVNHVLTHNNLKLQTNAESN